MAEFKRSPSKIWWASESIEWREISESPRSHDSGFSDSEQSIQKISENIYKQSPPGDKPENLSINYQEKISPKKSIKSQLRLWNSPKISRNLFNSDTERSTKDVVLNHRHQYSKDIIKDTTTRHNNNEIILSRSCGVVLDGQLFNKKTKEFLNKSAPAAILVEEENNNKDEEDEEEKELDFVFNGNHSLSSDCESELECLFNGSLDSPPKHTSTPKGPNKMRETGRRNLFLKCQRRERICQNVVETIDNEAVQKWMSEIQSHYDQECMTTLQSKSIAGELNLKVGQMATLTTKTIRSILSHAECINTEYRNLSSEKKHVGPLAQSLAGNIFEFFNTYQPCNTKITDEIKLAKNEKDILNLVTNLYTRWQSQFQEILKTEVKKLVDKLENPCSELDLRATVTGVTSVCLRNELLVEIFIKNNTVPILLILCEKCEGSSMRSLLFRALATMCCNAYAVRQFEKFSGIHIISETLGEDQSRPEPERSEAVALLAQVTAPWIEDNHTLKGLENYSRKLVKALTKFIQTTKCCQNLLLCAAALANMSTMYKKSIKHILHMNTVQILLESMNRRGPCISLYLFEQMATLIANIVAVETARKQMITLKTVEALLFFLKVNNNKIGEEQEVEKRLQQKAIIALSRLCSEKEAAMEVVELGGVQKLVRLCKEKNERFGSDAVLVATLATLRKIADTCGRNVVNNEDAQELIEPKLLDSFLAYSSQSESYV